MKTRVVTGVVLVALISLVIWLGGWWLRGVALLLMLLSMHEMYAAYRFKGLRPVPVGLAFAPLLLFCALVLPGDRVMEAAVSLMALLAAAGEACLRSMGFGYRAPYLVETARRVADGFDLDGLTRCDYETAHRALVTLPGVGDKVACCVQLFSLGDRSAFPVDVWVRRAMRDWLGIDKKDVRAEALRLFGPQAGLVQQYLFHCARTGIISCNREREDVSYAGTLGERGDDHTGGTGGLAPARRHSGEV